MSGTQSDPWADFSPRAAAPASDPWAEFSPQAQPEQPSALGRAFRTADNVVRQVARGATLGYADELSAAARTGAGLWGDYGAALAEERSRDAEFSQEHPWVSTAAQVAGGVASPVARLGNFARGSSLLGTMGRSAVLGAGVGGAAGFGEGEGGLAPRLDNALTGAAIGGAIGGAAPAVIEGGARIVRGVRNAVSGAPSRADAERIILRDLSRSGMSADDLATASREAGAAPVMLADIGGENVLQSAQVVARTPGAGRQLATEALSGRGGTNQASRLSSQVRDLVSGDDFATSTNRLLDARRTAAAPRYEAAFSRIVPTEPEAARVMRFVRDPIGQDALQRGLRVIELEHLARDQPFNPAAYGVTRGEGGRFELATGFRNLRLMDAVKRGFDDIVEGFRDPTSGRLNLTPYGRAVNDARAAYTGTLREMYPRYANALNAWAGPSQALDVMNRGRRLLSLGPEEFERAANDIGRLSRADRELFRSGLGRGLLDRIESATDAQDLTRLNKVFGTPAIRNRLRAAFDSDADFNRFAMAMQREISMARTGTAIAPRGGSPTMPMTEKAADLRAPPGGAVSRGLLADGAEPPRQGLLRILTAPGESVTSAPNALLRRFVNNREDAAFRRTTDALAPYLFTTDRAARDDLVSALLARQLTDAARRQWTNPAAQAASRGAIAGAVPRAVE